MFDTLCALPLTSELFTQSLHPTSPLLAVGLASGHVQTYRLPSDSPSASPEPSSSDSNTLTSNSNATHPRSLLRRSSTSSNSSAIPLISTAWRTHRHKGSCRCLAFSLDGSLLFSAGTDGLVKCARSETGRVEAKIAVPEQENGNKDQPCLVHPLTPTAFLLATDSGALHLYDTRIIGAGEGAGGIFGVGAAVPSSTWRPHGDFVTSISPLAASETSTSGLPRQFVTTGDTTCSLVDVRKGIVGASSEGNEILNGSCVVGGRIFTGDTGGSLTVWDKSVVKDWEEGIGRQKVNIKRTIRTPEGDEMEIDAPDGESVDVLCSMPASIAERTSGRREEMGVLGWDSGRIELVSFAAKGKRGKVESAWQCDETDGVVALDFDVDGRLVAGAGEVVKIYASKSEDAIESDEEEDNERELDDDEDTAVLLNGKRPHDDDGDDEDNDNDEEDEEAESSEEEKTKQKRKKRKKQKQPKHGKGKKDKQQTFSFAGLD